MWKTIRIVILLFFLVKAVQVTILEQSNLDWKKSFYVAVYPINADGSEEVNAYIKTLTPADFEEVSEYFSQQGRVYHLTVRRPVEMLLGNVVKEIPPPPPQTGNQLESIIWSLKFRYFDWLQQSSTAIKPDMKMYLLFYNPETSMVLSHSTALDKGRIGRVNLFGTKSYHRQNLVILAHEFLHTVKATDKYSLSTQLPMYPDGYAEPYKKPLHPQRIAELMGGRIPVDENSALIPHALKETKIGIETAKEIGWIR